MLSQISCLERCVESAPTALFFNNPPLIAACPVAESDTGTELGVWRSGAFTDCGGLEVLGGGGGGTFDAGMAAGGGGGTAEDVRNVSVCNL